MRKFFFGILFFSPSPFSFSRRIFSWIVDHSTTNRCTTLHPGSASGTWICPPLANFNLTRELDWIYIGMPPLFFYNLYGRPSEMNITGTLPPLFLMAKWWSQILRDTSPRHACLGEVSRESASRQSRELIMRSERTTNVQRGGKVLLFGGGRRESQGRVSLPFV